MTMCAKVQDIQNLKPLCRFYLMGSCHFGEDCTYRHDCRPEGGIEAAKQTLACPFFLKGKCRHRERCYFLHESHPEYRNKTTARSVHCEDDGCDHQDILEISATSQLEAPSSDQPTRVEHSDNQGDANICGVCLSDVSRKGSRFALYSNCSHCFCYDCARKWHRDQKPYRRAQGVDIPRTLLNHSCPVCRVESDFIVPSKYFYTGEDKAMAITEYKKKRATRECKFFEIGVRGSCPFGPKCFYAHKDFDGSDMKLFDVSKQKGVPKKMSVMIKSNYDPCDGINIFDGDITGDDVVTTLLGNSLLSVLDEW